MGIKEMLEYGVMFGEMPKGLKRLSNALSILYLENFLNGVTLQLVRQELQKKHLIHSCVDFLIMLPEKRIFSCFSSMKLRKEYDVELILQQPQGMI